MFIKKISQEKKCPIRSLRSLRFPSLSNVYYNLYGTTITPIDEVYYIWICLRETAKILFLNGYEKVFEIIYERLCIWL